MRPFRISNIYSTYFTRDKAGKIVCTQNYLYAPTLQLDFMEEAQARG